MFSFASADSVVEPTVVGSALGDLDGILDEYDNDDVDDRLVSGDGTVGMALLEDDTDGLADFVDDTFTGAAGVDCSDDGELLTVVADETIASVVDFDIAVGSTELVVFVLSDEVALVVVESSPVLVDSLGRVVGCVTLVILDVEALPDNVLVTSVDNTDGLFDAVVDVVTTDVRRD